MLTNCGKAWVQWGGVWLPSSDGLCNCANETAPISPIVILFMKWRSLHSSSFFSFHSLLVHVGPHPSDSFHYQFWRWEIVSGRVSFFFPLASNSAPIETTCLGRTNSRWQLIIGSLLYNLKFLFFLLIFPSTFSLAINRDPNFGNPVECTHPHTHTPTHSPI